MSGMYTPRNKYEVETNINNGSFTTLKSTQYNVPMILKYI